MDKDDLNLGPPVEPYADQIHDDNYVLNELKRLAVESSDVFNKSISDATRGLLDVASHYPASPERLRFFKNGTRQFLQYNTVPEYSHPEDAHILSPSAGDTVTLQTTDDVVYAVQYELSLTWAFALNQALQTGDRLRVGMFSDSDGWFFEQNDSHAPDEGDFVIRRNGSEVARETSNIEIATTEFARLRLQTAWYRITRQKWTRSYPVDGYQKNPDVARTDPRPNKGPSRGNLPLRYELTAGSGTTDLELEAGSMAALLMSQTERITRAKNYRETFSIGSTGTYVPIVAFRKDPGRDLVRTEFTDTTIPKFTGNGDIFGLLLACGKENVRDANGNQLTDSNFSYPNEFNPNNSVLQVTTDVAQFPDDSGTPVTSTTNPGGYQLGLSTRYTSGSGGKIQESGSNIDNKRVLSSGDYGVLAVRATDTGDFDYEMTVEQDW